MKHHLGRINLERDALRRNRLIAAGYRVLEVTNAQLDERPAEVVALVAAGLGMRLF
jgi:very-short-patch-repair endonuclease